MSLRLLVIEDDDAIADYLVRGFREEGYAVERAADGAEGRHFLRTGPWDAVLLDWWLPGADGITLLRQFRQSDPHTPVLMLTARDAVPDRVRGLDAGANDYLCKPFAFEELLARVRALTRRPEQAAGTTLTVADVKVDLATQRAERAGHRLELSAKEYALLLFFMRHPDEVLSRTRIYEGVWDERFDGVSNTLEVHVMGIRKQLERFGPRLLHTRRNRGYAFGPPEAGDE